MAILIEILAHSVINGLGLLGSFTDHHRWIRPLFAFLAGACTAIVLVAAVMILLGYD